MGKEFGNRVYKARVAQGLSQSELANKVGVSQAAVSNWEQGNTEPRLPEREKLESILGSMRRVRNRDNASGSDNDLEDSQANNAFGAWLQRARSRKDISVPELAQKSGVSTMAIYNIEAGKSGNPRAATRRKLSEALGIEVPADVQKEAEDSHAIEGLGPLTDFNPHDKLDRPSSPGVYVFYDVSERPIYVGKASDIAKRVAGHEDKFWFKFPIVANAAFVEIRDEDLRHQVEQVLIRFLKSNAVINRQSVVRDE